MASEREKELEAIVREFTPAARDILWCALVWNDHNFSYDSLMDKTNRAAKALGMERGRNWDSAKREWADGVELANAWMARIDAVMGSAETVSGEPKS